MRHWVLQKIAMFPPNGVKDKKPNWGYKDVSMAESKEQSVDMLIKTMKMFVA